LIRELRREKDHMLQKIEDLEREVASQQQTLRSKETETSELKSKVAQLERKEQSLVSDHKA
jgi:outer membrane murein-binding lipoprotein Lpp